MAIEHERIVVTGAAGWTARTIITTLRQHGARVTGVDLPGQPRPPELETWIEGDVADPELVHRAVRSADAVIHAAVAVADGDYARPVVPFATNVLGTYNVLEAARREEVPRVVLIGSAAVHVPPADGVLTVDDWRSDDGNDHLYDLTKRLQEETARDFCATFGGTAIVLRAGHLVDGRSATDPHGRPLRTLTYARGGWLCRWDLAEACRTALTARLRGYHAFHVIGDATAAPRFDLEPTLQQLGFQPRTGFAEFRGPS